MKRLFSAGEFKLKNQAYFFASKWKKMMTEIFFAKKRTIFMIFFHFFYAFCIDVDCDVTDRTDFRLCNSEKNINNATIFKCLFTHKNTEKSNTFYLEGHEENEADKSQRLFRVFSCVLWTKRDLYF